MTFQSTHPRRVRQNLSLLQQAVLVFQSTHPRRVRLSLQSIVGQGKSFNPRTHVGCDDMEALNYGFLDVSIHAPT